MSESRTSTSPSEPAQPGAPAPDAADLAARARALTRHVASIVERPVRLRITDNRHTVLSARIVDGTLEVRAHHMFLRGDEALFHAVGLHLSGRARGPESKVIDRFVASHKHLLDGARQRALPLRTRGRFYDLEALRDALAERYFGGPLDVRITWGRAPSSSRRGRRRSIQLGLYTHEERLIRIHPHLDRDFVPDYFVAFVVFHEMLHHVLPTERRGERRCVHTPAFRAHERRFEHYERARLWEQQNLDRLLAPDARTGR